MPKMKTHSGAKKRFSVTRTGKVQARAACKRHRLVSKSKRMKAEGRATRIMTDMDAKVILDNFLPYSQVKRRKARSYVRRQHEANAAAKAAKKEAA